MHVKYGGTSHSHFMHFSVLRRWPCWSVRSPCLQLPLSSPLYDESISSRGSAAQRELIQALMVLTLILINQTVATSIATNLNEKELTAFGVDWTAIWSFKVNWNAASSQLIHFQLNAAVNFLTVWIIGNWRFIIEICRAKAFVAFTIWINAFAHAVWLSFHFTFVQLCNFGTIYNKIENYYSLRCGSS